ncbi:Hypothetical protein CINCED_3A002568 [Cinara cedri]|uniref:ELYS-like domain-containing protein n=1 Tax=Cinara cedri TaxID=506608 RepID=A0A5E4NN10_9HEMI|nr:Hypothetical protein CINCED_3A002568 [Cinara cedri]
MAALKEVMHTISSQRISNQWLESNCDKSGGFLMRGQYVWFAFGANIVLYSKQLGFILSSRSFDSDQKDKSFKITSVKELYNNKKTNNFLLVGCSFKSSGKLFVCQLPTLTTIRCIELPWPISYIDKIKNNSHTEDQFCDEFKLMSTILLVGMVTGAVYAIDLRQDDIEEELRHNGVIVNESRPNKLLMIKKNDCQEIKEMRGDTNCHLAMFINEKFHTYCKKQFTNKLKLSVSCLMFIEEINTIAMGFSTGHFQLWDCKIKRTICSLEEPNCFMPITHISFLEPSDDPNNLCYLWVIQSDNSKLPSATMIGLNYKHRIMMPNGFSSYRTYAGNGIKLQVNLKKESGIGRCISAFSMCNMNPFRDENDIDEDSEIRLFSMLIEICRNPNDDPECFVFVFDINQWYKAQMPSVISHLKVSNMYASFVKLPHNAKYLDFNISEKSLRPFGYNFGNNNIEELYYPSSMYFECDCLVKDEIISFKHAGIQQEILDQLLLKSWKLLINPTLVFNQCLQTNLKPFFWDKTDDYVNYSLPDQRSFLISILVENKLMSVISACAEEWKNGTYISSEATILHLVQCLWKHVMAVKQYADKLCVPLFDYSGTQMDKKNQKILSYCLSQMQCVKHFLEYLSNAYGANIINVDYSYRVFTLNLVTEYFKAVICFLNYGLLPESHEIDSINHIIQCDFTSLIQYAVKRRTEFGNLKFYLIDAIVYNDPKGNKLIEQWQHEGCEITKGLYPPSNVQCLLRIYLNAALTDTVKNFITIYFLIDVCASLNLDIKVANRMCNFALEFDVENKILNTLCRASWLFDHDMFEDAIKVLSNDNDWSKIESKSWNWFHWTVLKLLVFKKEYFWAQIYMKITKMEFVNVEEQKFYINLQIMNNKSFDVFNFIHARPINKHILYEYLFDRLKEVKNLKCLIEYPFECDEEELFLNYLKRFKDMATITIKLLFLLQRGRYLEASEQKKLFRGNNKSKCNDALAITNLLVNGFDKCTPDIMKKKYICPPVKNLYKKTDVVLKYVNSDNRIFNIIEEKNDSVKISDPSIQSNPINLIIPLHNDNKKRSPTFDIVPILKRKKINDTTCSPKAIDDIPKPMIQKQELEILNTPLVTKSISQTLVKNISSILKTSSAKKVNQTCSIKSDTIGSKTSLRFSLPGNNNTQPIEQNIIKEIVETSKIDNQRIYSNKNRNDIVNKSIAQSLSLNEILEENSKIDQCKPMEICAEFEISDIFHPNSNINQINHNSLNKKVILLSDKEEENIKNNTKLIPETPNCSTSKAYLSDLTSNEKTDNKQLNVPGNTNETSHQHSTNTVFKNDNVQSNIQDNLCNKSKSFIKNIPVISLDSDTESNCSCSVKTNGNGSSTSGEVSEEQSISSDEQSVDDEQSVYSDEEQSIYSDEQIDNKQNTDSNIQLIDDDQTTDSDVLLIDDDQNTDSDMQLIDDESVDNGQITNSDVQPTDNESVDNDQITNSDVQPTDNESVDNDQNTDSDVQIIDDVESLDDVQIIDDVESLDDVQIIDDVESLDDVELVDEEQETSSEVHSIDDESVDEEQDVSSDEHSVDYSQSDESDLEITRSGRFKYQQNIKDVDLEEETDVVEKKRYEDIEDIEVEKNILNQQNAYEKMNDSIEEEILSQQNAYEKIKDSIEKEMSSQQNAYEKMNDSGNTTELMKSEHVNLCENPLTNVYEYDTKHNYSVALNLSKSHNSTSFEFDRIKETHHHSNSIEDIEVHYVVENENIVDSNPNDQTNLKEDEYVIGSQNVVENENIAYSNSNDQTNLKEVEYVIDIAYSNSNDQTNAYSNSNDQTNLKENSNDQTNLKEVEYVIGNQNEVENENFAYSNPNDQTNLKEDEYVIGSQNVVENENIAYSNPNDQTNLKEVEYVIGSQNVVENETIVDSNPSYQDNSKAVKKYIQIQTIVDSNPSYQDNSKETIEYMIGSQNVVKNENIVDSNLSNSDKKGTIKYVHETNSGNILINKDKSYNTEVEPVNNENSIHTDENDFKMLSNESNLVSCNDFKNHTISKTELSQQENIEINHVNQPTPFLFGKAFFGQQEKLENKPLLFGQLYTSEKEQVVDLHNDELGIQNVISINNHEEDILINKVPEEREVIDEMQDILELESLPESNPDENTDVPLILNTNEGNQQSLKQSSVLLGTYQLSKTINSTLVSKMEMKSQQPLLQDVTKIKNPPMDPSNLQKFDKEQSFAKESSTNQSDRIIITRSRAKSVSSKLEGNPNLFRLFDGDDSKQVRVSLNRKKSKSQENISLTKRKREKSKSPIDNLITTKKTVFGLEKIPEEGSCSNVDKTIETKPTKKSKFNFLKHTSKVVKHENFIHLQEDIKVKTPKKSKSVYSEPAATMSVVKKNRSKRSSSINLVISDDESVTENEGYMEVLQKALGPNTKKSFRAASVPNRKKPKMITQKPSIDDSRPNLNETSTTSEDSITPQISPIEGNNSKHMLITPAKYQTKVPMKSLESETDDSSSDESTNSKCLARSMIIKETIVPAFTPDRRVTRSQTLNLDNSLQSTSLIGHDQTEKGLKSGTKKTVKRKNSIN